MDKLKAMVVLCVPLCLWMLGIAPSASAQCPFVLSPLDGIPEFSYDFSSPAFRKMFSRIDSTINEFVTNYSVSSYAVGVVLGTETIYTSGLTSTPYRVASITKTFTSLGALMLREQGLLHLDDPVKKFLADFSIINPWGKHDTTLRELMAHVAGFPLTLCPFLFTCTDDETEILKQISGMQLARPPWSREPIYSNLGISVLGHAWEKATSPRKSWAQFVMEDIVKPLGLTNTGINLTDVELARSTHPLARQDLGWSAPAAQMYSTVNDLTKYLKFLLEDNPSLISSTTRREWTRPTKLFADGMGGFGMPWELYKLDANSTDFIISKTGAINSYLSHLALYPPIKLGIVMLSVYDKPLPVLAPPPEALVKLLLRLLIPGVEAVNQEALTTSYAGVYNCDRTLPLRSSTVNGSIQVLGGSITVDVNSTLGLTATIAIPVLNDGVRSDYGGTWSLLLKNATENCFFFGSGPCGWYVGGISAYPDLTAPNVPGSFYTNELFFNLQNSSITWPAVGAQCFRS